MIDFERLPTVADWYDVGIHGYWLVAKDGRRLRLPDDLQAAVAGFVHPGQRGDGHPSSDTLHSGSAGDDFPKFLSF
jgi:hypothetical protein